MAGPEQRTSREHVDEDYKYFLFDVIMENVDEGRCTRQQAIAAYIKAMELPASRLVAVELPETPPQAA